VPRTAPTARAGTPTGQASAGVEVAPLDDLVAHAARLQAICLARGLTVATAESCTGGLVGHVLTEVPGASGYFLGGVVSYSDALKGALLGVSAEALVAHGAVSAQVAIAMASGAREHLGSDLGLAVTGIAGPEGGTPEKPVGLTYVAVAEAAGCRVERHLWGGDRDANKRASARALLELALAGLGPGDAA
jgi:nicotinamide-nucleotide amidase